MPPLMIATWFISVLIGSQVLAFADSDHSNRYQNCLERLEARWARNAKYATLISLTPFAISGVPVLFVDSALKMKKRIDLIRAAQKADFEYGESTVLTRGEKKILKYYNKNIKKYPQSTLEKRELVKILISLGQSPPDSAVCSVALEDSDRFTKKIFKDGLNGYWDLKQMSLMELLIERTSTLE